MFARWKDPFAKIEKKRRVAAKHRGWERKRARGRIRVWRLGGLGPIWATLSQFSKHLFFWQNNLAN